jgi:hypothetical protein
VIGEIRLVFGHAYRPDPAVSATLITALLLQVVAIALLRHRLGKLWLRRPVTLLVLASVVYQGVSPVLLAFPSVRYWDIYRVGVQQSYIDSAILVMSAGMLALTLAYLLTRPERAAPAVRPADILAAARILDWRMLALACAPLAVLTYEGRGYNHGATASVGTSLSTNLAGAFFIVMVVLTAFSFLLSRGTRWFMPVLIVQSLVLAAAGERLPVIMAAIALVLALAQAEVRPAGRQLFTAAALTVVVALAITGVRAEQGRAVFYQDSGIGTRVSALAGGLSAAASEAASGGSLIAQAADRLDAVDFAGAILQAEHLGQPRLSATDVPESLLLAVPSAVWPSKLDHANGLNPTLMEISDFGLQPVNFLPGLAGMYMGFLSPAWLITFLAIIGFLAGWAERLLFRRQSPVRMVLFVGGVIAALNYEQGIQGILLDVRSAVAIALVVKLIEIVRMRRTRTQGTQTYAVTHLSSLPMVTR